MRVAHFILAGILLAASASGEPVERATPLFDAVKTFCFDTGARYDGVKAAAEKAGAVNTQDDDQNQEWRLNGWAKGHDLSIRLFVLVGDVRSARSPLCSIVSAQREDASVEALKAWAAVTPDVLRTSDQVDYHFRFQIKDGAAKETGGREADRKAANEDRCWYLGIYAFESTVDAVLSRCDREPEDPNVVRRYGPLFLTDYNTKTDTLFLQTSPEPPPVLEGPPEHKSKKIAPDVSADLDNDGKAYGYTIQNASKHTDEIGKLLLDMAKKE